MPTYIKDQKVCTGLGDATSTSRISPYTETKEVTKSSVNIAVLLVGVVLLVIVSSIVIWYRCASQISFGLSVYMGKIPANKSCSFDVMVIHDTDDSSFVSKHFYQKLKEELGYKPYITGLDMKAGQEFEQGREVVSDSYSIMFILTPDDVGDAKFSHLLRLAVDIDRSIILVEVHKEGKPALDWEELKRSKSLDQDNTLKNGLKFLTNVKWPGDDASARELDKFWYKVRKKLPKLEANGENLVDSSKKSEVNLEMDTIEPRETSIPSEEDVDLSSGVQGKHQDRDIQMKPSQVEADEQVFTRNESDSENSGDDHPHPRSHGSVPTNTSYSEITEIPDRRLGETWSSSGRPIPKQQLSVVSADSGVFNSLDLTSPTSTSLIFGQIKDRKFSVEPIQEQDIDV